MLGIAAMCLLTLGACKKDKIDYADSDANSTENIGYLSFAEFEATVMEDTENITSTPKTRAEAVDINTFDVQIMNNEGGVITTFKYGERPTTEPLALEAGVYKVVMSSGQMQGAAWESPIYGASKEFTVTRKQTTTVSDIVCKLSNVKVTVGYAADIAAQFDAEYTKMTVELAESGLEYAFNETRAGYFAPVAQENTLKLTFNCRYAGTTKDIIMTNEIKGVRAAQWRKINVVVQHASDGSATIGIVCDTWTYDEEVTFDTSTMMMEVEIPDDTDAPVINWEGHDLTQPFELSDDMFDADGNFTSSINVDVTAKNPLKSLVVKVSSDNSEFITAYEGTMPLEVDLCNTTTSALILNLMGYPTNVSGEKTARIKFAAQAATLKSYEGTYNYEITAVDQNGASATATLVIQHITSLAPRIVWTGYDIDKQQTYVAGMTCDLQITAPMAVADLAVKIISQTLTPEELAGVGLAGEFSLIRDTQYFEALKKLGFPVGDEVQGKTELNLSITNFLGVLNMLGSGDHNFEISVTDTEGNTTTKTVMMHFE